MQNIQSTKKEYKWNGKKVVEIALSYIDAEYPKPIGTLYITKGNRLYHKRVDSKKHKLRIFNGYGIQREVFDEYLRNRNGRVIIDETDTQMRLTADIKTWVEHGSNKNYGEGKQTFLPIKYMEVSRKL